MRHVPPTPNDPAARAVATIADLTNRVIQLEKGTEPRRSYTSGYVSGNMELNTKTATRMLGANQLNNVPPGTYLFGMSMLIQQRAAGLNGMAAALCNAGTSAGMFVNPLLYYVGQQQWDAVYVTNVVRGTIYETMSFVPYCWCDVPSAFYNVTMWATPCN